MANPSEGKKSELGDFLRSRRERLTPNSLGLPEGRRRRTPGLRREEVAELAGIGVDWYIRLEQGRNVSASSTTLNSLARVLRLSKAEAMHLRALAQNAGRRPHAPENVPAALQRMVKGLNQPAYITGRRWDVLVWNAAANKIFTFSSQPEGRRNILINMLVHPDARQLFGPGWADEAKRMVAQFRATHDLWAGDPAFADLLECLNCGCPEFSTWWEMHDIRSVEAGQKMLHLPKIGTQSFEYASFQANDDPSLKLVIYTRV
jgi:transcriptional regulator with XRE-family HTH domain